MAAPIQIKISPQARRIILRVQPNDRRVEITMPPWTSKRAAGAFAARHLEWIEQRLQALPQPVPFTAGAAVPLQGVEHRIESSGSLRGAVVCQNGRLVVPGDEAHLARRVSDFLRAEARRVLGERVRVKAIELGVNIASISLRDTTSRWGSAAPTGRLCFSWRLILAPDWILDYVVAHEVAHLRHMDHSANFWACCAELTDSDVEAARAWLSRHGSDLLRYGQQAVEEPN